jgi:hypothetical protein
MVTGSPVEATTMGKVADGIGTVSARPVDGMSVSDVTVRTQCNSLYSSSVFLWSDRTGRGQTFVQCG